jgi:hypothetical protein
VLTLSILFKVGVIVTAVVVVAIIVYIFSSLTYSNLRLNPGHVHSLEISFFFGTLQLFPPFQIAFKLIKCTQLSHITVPLPYLTIVYIGN